MYNPLWNFLSGDRESVWETVMIKRNDCLHGDETQVVALVQLYLTKFNILNAIQNPLDLKIKNGLEVEPKLKRWNKFTNMEIQYSESLMYTYVLVSYGKKSLKHL